MDAARLRTFMDQRAHRTHKLWDLFWLLLHSAWRQQMANCLLSFWTAFSRLLFALLLSAILYIAGGDYPWWLAILPAVTLVLVDASKTIALQQMFFKGSVLAYIIRSSLVGMIYDKSLRLSPKAQTSISTGVILNYITVDVSHTRHFWVCLRDWFYCPLVLTSSLVFLTFEVGAHNMGYGVCVLFVCQLFGYFATRLSTKYADTQLERKDDRLKLTNDILQGIRVLKLYGWEDSMMRITAAIRKRELKELLKARLVEAWIEASFDATPFFATLITFYGYLVVDGNVLTPRKAFVVLFLFDMVRYACFRLPMLLVDAVKTFVSLRRVIRFLNEDERPATCVQPLDEADTFVVDIADANYSWTADEANCQLRDINMHIRRGALIGIHGAVGAGKSTLLSVIAGELNAVRATRNIVRANSMAYVPQQAWIQNMTLRANVLFDAPFDAERYERVLAACALRDDLDVLPHGDLTEIGERGINLSGGQKARVALARAVYRRADFCILDDPLSAVDSHVGQHIFDHVLGANGLLAGSTRIVAINSITFVDKFDHIISLRDGKIVYYGEPQAFLEAQTSSIMTVSQSSATKADNSESEAREKAAPLVAVAPKKPAEAAANNLEADVLVEEETWRAGRVLGRIYIDYLEAYGWPIFAVYALLMVVCWPVLFSLGGLYMARWSNAGANQTRDELLHNLLVYGGYNIGVALVTVLGLLTMSVGLYRASERFHADLLRSILRAPLSFFDSTPMGRIFNRFSTDMELLDVSLGQEYTFVVLIMAETLKLLVTTFVVLPLLIPCVVPLIIILVAVARYFNAATAQFRRLASNAMSHVCSAVQDVKEGAASIRVYGTLERFRQDFTRRLNRTVESNMAEVVASGWVQVRMDIATDVTVLVFLIIALWSANEQWISLGMLGLVVNSCVNVCGVFGDLAECYRDAETEIVCVERLKEYQHIENEPIWKHPSKSTLLNSSVEFRDVSLRYRAQDPPVLHKINFRVEAGERVGVVGRTGAGKTSLTSLLFRLVEPFEGEIRVGEASILDLGRSLRNHLTIIPQDPILFCGKLRANLDPFDEYTDEQLWRALEKAHLAAYVHSLPDGLEHEVADGGNNLSVGQRQLVCLGRALLREPKILILDEATAAVDAATDTLVQQTIRKEFAASTVIAIAHRLETVMDYDKILVLRAGRVIEYDAPNTLLAQPASLFREFAQRAGLV